MDGVQRVDEGQRPRQHEAGFPALLAKLAQELGFVQTVEAAANEPVEKNIGIEGSHGAIAPSTHAVPEMTSRAMTRGDLAERRIFGHADIGLERAARMEMAA